MLDFFPDENTYKMCCVLLTLDELKQKGLMEEGLNINKEKIQELLAFGKRMGYDKPNLVETEEICNAIQRSILKRIR